MVFSCFPVPNYSVSFPRDNLCYQFLVHSPKEVLHICVQIPWHAYLYFAWTACYHICCFTPCFSVNVSWRSFCINTIKVLSFYIDVSSLIQHIKPRQLVKKQRHQFANKGLYSQSYGFSSSRVRMWELDHKEGWVLKNRCLWTVVLEKTLESPLDCKEIQPVNSKGNQFWRFIGRTDAEAEAPILWPLDANSQLTGKDPDAGKDWGQKEKRMAEDQVVR